MSLGKFLDAVDCESKEEVKKALNRLHADAYYLRGKQTRHADAVMFKRTLELFISINTRELYQKSAGPQFIAGLDYIVRRILRGNF